MDPVTLLADLKARDVRLSPLGDRLQVDAPAGVLTAEMRQWIAAYKGDLLALLRGELPASPADWPGEWRESFEERAAIMEHDGHLPRPEAERRAEELVRKAFQRTQWGKPVTAQDSRRT